MLFNNICHYPLYWIVIPDKHITLETLNSCVKLKNSSDIGLNVELM